MRRACVKPALLAFLWLCLVANSWASTFKVPLTATCLSEVAAAYQVHPDILLAILLVEGGTVGQVSRMNSNGTYDIGPFQINSTHRSALAAMHISEDELRNNGCTNAAVAGWLLRRAVSVEEEQQIFSAHDGASREVLRLNFDKVINRLDFTPVFVSYGELICLPSEEQK